MSVFNLFRSGRRAASSSRRVDMMNDHMLRDIGLRRADRAFDRSAFAAVPFTRYTDR